MLVVVSDSSPIIYLTRLGLLPLLPKLHESVVVPQAVWDEVAVGGKGRPESDNLKRAVSDGWIHIKTPSASAASLGAGASQLGRGEVEAILLARELQAILLTDDSDGRALAEQLGVKVTGTVGILIRAKTERHITAVKPLLDRLRTETNFRMSERLYQEALTEGGEQPSQPRN